MMTTLWTCHDECLVGDHVKAWDQKLCQAEFAHNHAINRSTGFSPFQVVYSAQPCGPLDLMTLPVSGFVPKKVQDFVEGLHEVHKAVRDNLHFVFPYHGDSSDDDLVVNSGEFCRMPGENSARPKYDVTGHIVILEARRTMWIRTDL
ncbi:putative reverse transcriptase domain-containing protein [Tanacetum coccineum]